MKIVGIIPARYASTRFPGKPLAVIAGMPLIRRVVVQCQKAKSLAEVIVATDDLRIAEVAQKFCRVEMTSPTIRAVRTGLPKSPEKFPATRW